MSILFNNPLLGASGNQGGGGDLGDTIEQSLRFTGTQNLTKTMAAGAETTFSCWVKIANLAQTSAMTFIGAGIGTNYVQLYWEGATYETLGADNSNTSFAFTSNKLRDPSAWYHLVYVRTSSDTKIYINGAEASYRTSGSGSNGALSSTTFAIGSYANGTGKFEGYMAEVYFVESVKQPSDFGKYNEDGVWVPQDYTGTYGTNGFHLTFDSSQANGIGHDSSGNGNNFTASGFDEGDVALYSKDLFTNASTATPNYNTTDKTFLASNGADKAFDGSPSTQASTTYSPNTGTWIIFRPSTAIVANSSVQVRTYYNETITVNEVDTGLSNPSSSTISTVDISSALTFPVTIQTIGLRGNSTGSLSEARVFQIIVDGTVLVDNTDNDVDYDDTPTSNYATFNTVHTDTAGGATLEEGNLFLSATGGATRYVDARSTIPASECNCYVEMYVRTKSGSNALIGIGVGDHESRISLGTGAYVCYRQNGGIIEYPGNTTLGTESSYDAGDVIGMTVNSTQVAFYKNGTLEGTYNHGLTGDFFVIGMAYDNGHNSEVEFNFGQRNFIYTIPTGFSALQTNNLPEPTIKNAKEYFEAKLYSGTNSSNAITGLEFSPDLIWIKVRDAADNHVLVDTIRGTDSVLFSNSEDAEASSFSRFTSFDSNGFTVDTSDTSWNNSSNNYVAWCWKAGTDYTPTLTGFTAATASINTEAGFGIYALTGNNTASSFTHGLDKTPELIICKNRDDSEDWAVFYPRPDGPPTPTDTYLRLNEQTDENKSGTQILTGNTSTTVSVASYNETASSDDYIYYLWHSVEGFSKMGRYQGNGSSDGVFVYCGFRPAFVMVKGTGTTNGWGLYDNARFENNPVNGLLYANSSNRESAFVNRPMDFLSNGFKCRDGNTNLNASASYMFMAFAEHPFGGENAPPVTAR